MQIACGEVGSADWLGVTLGAERDEPDRAEHGARRNVRQEAAPRCLTDIDWVPAWAQRASCGDHERRAPARRRRRRGLDRDYRECAAADLARGVSRRGVVRPFASPASSSSNSRARTSPVPETFSQNVRRTSQPRLRQPLLLVGRCSKLSSGRFVIVHLPPIRSTLLLSGKVLFPCHR